MSVVSISRIGLGTSMNMVTLRNGRNSGAAGTWVVLTTCCSLEVDSTASGVANYVMAGMARDLV